MNSSPKPLPSSLAAIISLGLGSSCIVLPAHGAVLEEVVVEAQKKSETVTETPIAIQVLTGDQFQKYASFSFLDIARTTPGLSFDGGVTPDIHLRGVSTVTLGAVSLRTNVYFDGVLAEQPRAVLDTQYDIERFEVIKGAQGTLYGKSSPTGTINVRSRNPNLSEIDGYVAGSIGQRNLYNTQFGISLPIIAGELGVRLAGTYDENQSSGIKNVTTDRDAQSRGSGMRFTVLWEPNDKLTARLSYQYREKKENQPYVLSGDGFNFDDYKLHSDFTDVNKYRDQLGSFEVSYGLSDHLSLTSVTGYEDQNFDNAVDIDALAAPINPANAALLGGMQGDVQFSHIPDRPFVQEDLRLASEDNDFWDWQLGFFYLREASGTSVRSLSYSDKPVPAYADVNIKLFYNTESYALYTHQTFKLTDSLNIIAGLRTTNERDTARQPINGTAAFLLGGTTGTTDLIQSGILLSDGIPAEFHEKTSHPVTGTLKAQYFFNPDLMSYISLDRAYRGGAPNINVMGNVPSDLAFIDPEAASSIELGLKGNFGDQRGRFAATIYDQIYKGFQQDFQNLTLSDGSLLQSVVTNAKEAETRGVEFNIAWLLEDNWNVELNTAFADSKFTDFKNAPASIINNCGGTANGKTYATCDLSGERLPLASRWAGNIASNYSLPAFTGTDWYLNTLINFQSNQIDKVTRSTLGGYSTVDLFTGIRSSKSNTWDINLWLKNAFDRRVITRVYRANVPTSLDEGSPTFDMVAVNLPRQLGLTGTYHF
jgi:iron complex outermembrane receptor protein